MRLILHALFGTQPLKMPHQTPSRWPITPRLHARHAQIFVRDKPPPLCGQGMLKHGHGAELVPPAQMWPFCRNATWASDVLSSEGGFGDKRRPVWNVIQNLSHQSYPPKATSTVEQPCRGTHWACELSFRGGKWSFNASHRSFYATDTTRSSVRPAFFLFE